MPVSNRQTGPHKPAGKRKLLLFRLLALALPLVILAVAERALRLAGYGHDLGLFVPAPDNPGYLVMNRYASARFFTDSGNATIGNRELFRRQKAPDTFRIFVLGESTTIGFPYMHNGAFHRWLQFRLLHTFPEKNFEIINLSLTAVNSYTVLDFGRQLLPYEPDAVLVYTGHNEYYGALGVGSTSRLGYQPTLIKAWLALQPLRLVQGLNQVRAGIRQRFTGRRVDARDNLMKRMAADQQIPYGSATYQRGVRQFDANLRALCRLLSENKIPVFLSTLVSNEKDLPPFSSAAGPGSRSALYQYQQAGKAYARGDFKRARQLYGRARDLDLLRFRAPEAMNTVVRNLCRQYPGVFLVDAKALFERHSPQGILGNNTLLEHVHPNLLGYALLSEAFYQSLKKQKLLAPAWPPGLSWTQLRRQMPVTPVDSLMGLYQVQLLKKGWPFLQPLPAGFMPARSAEEKLAAALTRQQLSWTQAMDQLMQHYVGAQNIAGARRVAEAVLLEYPTDATFYVMAAQFSRQLQEQAKAVVYLEKAYRLQPGPQLARDLLGLHLELDQPERAILYLEAALGPGTALPNLVALPGLLQNIIQFKARLCTDSTNVYLLNQLAQHYQRLGTRQLADKYQKLAGRR
jgi:hypothetical protein